MPANGPSNAPRVILVLGMHRSGTSLLASVLHLLGVEFGGPLLAGRFDNPRGFWEHRDVVALHEEILARLDRAWPGAHASLPYPGLWWREARFAGLRQRLRALVERELAAAGGRWAFKDPRACRLLPLWRELLAEMRVEAAPVLALRHPGAVAASLAQRDGFDAGEAQLLWLQHALEPLRGGDGRMPPAVDFEEWLSGDPRVVARRLAAALGLSAPGEDPEQRLRAVVEPELRHHGNDAVDCSPIALEAYRLLREARVGEPVPARLAQLAEDLERHQALFAAWGERLARLTDPELAKRPLDRALLMDDERARWRAAPAAPAAPEVPALVYADRHGARRLRVCVVSDSDDLAKALAEDGHEVILHQPSGAASEDASWRSYRWLSAQPAFDVVHAVDRADALYHALMARRHGLGFAATTFVAAVDHGLLRAAARDRVAVTAGDLVAEHLARRAIECADYALVRSAADARWLAWRGVRLPPQTFLQPAPGDRDAWAAWYRGLPVAKDAPRPAAALGAVHLEQPLAALFGDPMGADLPPEILPAAESSLADAVAQGSTPFVVLLAAGVTPRPGALGALLQGILQSGADGCVCLAELGAPGGERLPALGGAVAALAAGCALAAPALIVRRAALREIAASLPARTHLGEADLNAIQVALTLARFQVDTLPAALFVQPHRPAPALPPACLDAVPALLHGLVWRAASSPALEDNERLRAQIAVLRGSISWRLTAPLRWLKGWFS